MDTTREGSGRRRKEKKRKKRDGAPSSSSGSSFSGTPSLANRVALAAANEAGEFRTAGLPSAPTGVLAGGAIPQLRERSVTSASGCTTPSPPSSPGPSRRAGAAPSAAKVAAAAAAVVDVVIVDAAKEKEDALARTTIFCKMLFAARGAGLSDCDA